MHTCCNVESAFYLNSITAWQEVRVWLALHILNRLEVVSPVLQQLLCFLYMLTLEREHTGNGSCLSYLLCVVQVELSAQVVLNCCVIVPVMVVSILIFKC